MRGHSAGEKWDSWGNTLLTTKSDRERFKRSRAKRKKTKDLWKRFAERHPKKEETDNGTR